MRAQAALAAIVLAATPAMAAKPGPSPVGFDGRWAVDIIVLRGTCERGYSFPVQVRSGAIVYAGQVDIKASGRIGRDGSVTARFTRHAETLSASGRLTTSSGTGAWTAPSRSCSGRWEARKEG